MAQPPAYTPNHDYSDWSTAFPASPHSGAYLDSEFEEIATVFAAHAANLALIQRDDGELANASVGIDQLKTDIDLGINVPTDWLTATAYVLRDAVWINSNKLYRCIEAHTSGTFATDLAAEKWSLIVDFSSAATDAATASAAAASATASAATATSAAASATALLSSYTWTWDTGTADADPGAGKIRANNATLASATKLFVSETDALGNDVGAVIARWYASTNTSKAILTVRKRDAATTFFAVVLTAGADDGAYRDLTATYVTGSGTFSDGDVVSVLVSPIGDVGAPGAGTGDVLAANLGSEYTAGQVTFRTNTGTLAASSYTAADVLTKLLTVDGAGSLIDADLLDGAQGSAYQLVANLLTGILAIDGAGSGIDADLLDGAQGSAYQTVASLLTAILAIDGAASGIDADLLDGVQGSAYLALAGTQTITGAKTIQATTTARTVLPETTGTYDLGSTSLLWLDAFMTRVQLGHASDTTLARSSAGNMSIEGNVVWHTGNDGAGTGLDADTVDGVQASAFALLAGATFTGPIRVQGTPTNTDDAGYLGCPVNTQNTAYTLVLADAGKTIYHDEVTARTYTIPANGSVAYPIGTTIVIDNTGNSGAAGAITLSITTDTLRRGDGTAGTGSRTISASQVAVIRKTKSTEWVITGAFT